MSDIPDDLKGLSELIGKTNPVVINQDAKEIKTLLKQIVEILKDIQSNTKKSYGFTGPK